MTTTKKKSFEDSYMGQLRQKVGQQLLIVPSFRTVIEDPQGRVLMIKRSDDGMWALPAGLPEPGESMDEFIRREVLEETGLTLQSYICYGFASKPDMETHTYPNGDRLHAYSLLTYSNDWTGEPRVNDDETTEVRFFAVKDLPDPKKILRNELNSLNLYYQFKKSGKFQLA